MEFEVEEAFLLGCELRYGRGCHGDGMVKSRARSEKIGERRGMRVTFIVLYCLSKVIYIYQFIKYFGRNER